MKYYDWQKTMSYDSPLTIVIGARGIGKTYGLRLHCLREHIRKGYRFVEIFRYKKELQEASRGYFDKLAQRKEFAPYEFRSDATGGYIRKAAGEGEKKEKWSRVCYFVPLTRFQEMKKNTFTNVKRIIFDEFILDRSNSYARYLPNEFSKVANLVDTVTREQAGDKSAPHAYLLGNAVDLINPYFAALGITTPPPHGISWHAGKTALIHMVPIDDTREQAKRQTTLAGRMLALAGDDAETAAAAANQFTTRGESFIDKNAKVEAPVFMLIWKGKPLTVWTKKGDAGMYHVRAGVNRECEREGRAYYFHREDSRIDFTAAKRNEKRLKWLPSAYASGRITAQAHDVNATFCEILTFLGLPL